MKLEKILDTINSFEKNSFLKIIDNILSSNPRNGIEVDKILAETSKDLKNVDNINITKVFNYLHDEFSDYVKCEFVNTSSQLDIVIDIISREGNAIMKQDWFARLYEKELDLFQTKVKKFKKSIDDEKSEIPEHRLRDYRIYKNCLYTAYYNDEANNQDKKITSDEQSILLTLAQQLGLSQEEIKMINYSVLPIKKSDIDTLINELKSIGVIFYAKKTNTIYVADEVVSILRKIRGKEVSDKFFRRVLKLLREPVLNMVCKKHGVDWKLSVDEKINLIISEGISFKGLLTEDIYKDGTPLNDKKKFLNELIESGLKIEATIKGLVIEDKVDNLIKYFESQDRDDKIGISIDGYERLLADISEVLPAFKTIVRKKYEFQEENVMTSAFLLDFNIKPRDIVELIPSENLTEFVKAKEIKSRGDLINNVLEAYKDAENLFMENYELIAYRDLNGLKSNGISVKEADLGVKFEDLTKTIFEQLGFDVDEKLRKTLNTNKDKADILLNIGNNEIIIVECKTSKESGFNKFSAVSRQLKAYSNRINEKGYKVVKSLLIAPEFSDDFIKECGIEYELNLSLIKASTLSQILTAFKASKLKKFPHNLLMRDVVIQEDRVVKAIGK